MSAPEAVSRCGTIMPSVEEMRAVGGRPASASASARGCFGGRGISERGWGGGEEGWVSAVDEGWVAVVSVVSTVSAVSAASPP